MKLEMEWQGKRFFSGMTDKGHEIMTDSLPEFGGENRSATPMEMLLGSVIGCTGIDIVSILEKMKYPPQSFDIHATGDRAQSHPRAFTDIHLHYMIKGEIPEDKLYRAIELSLNKYCSVAYSLRAELTATYTLNEGEKKTVDLD
jgi:putative redox protein